MKVKPFYVDTKKYNLTAQQAQDILNMAVEAGAVGRKIVANTSPTYKGLEGKVYSTKDYPYVGVGRTQDTLVEVDFLYFNHNELSPEEVPSWLGLDI